MSPANASDEEEVAKSSILFRSDSDPAEAVMLVKLPNVSVLSKGSTEHRGSPENPVTMFLTVVVVVEVMLQGSLDGAVKS